MTSHKTLCNEGLVFLESLVEDIYFLHSQETLYRGLVNFKASIFSLESSLTSLDDSEDAEDSLVSMYFEALREGISFLTEALLQGEEVESQYERLSNFIKEQRRSPLVKRYKTPQGLYSLVS